MKSTADKREREKRIGNDCPVLPQKTPHQRRTLSRMCRSGSLCQDEKRQVSVYGDENLLFQL